MKKKLSLMAVMGLITTNILAGPQVDSQKKWITVDNDVLEKIQKDLQLNPLYEAEGATVIEVSGLQEIEKLSHTIHSQLHRCGGFVQHDSQEEAESALTSMNESFVSGNMLFADYSIDQQNLVTPMVNLVEESSIREMIISLSSYRNRYYKSETGVESAHFIRDTWKKLSSHRSDVEVSLYEHRNWPQPSIIMTVEGSENPEDIIILGGHADSIAGMWGGARAIAPGADDNASGIATITEVIKVLMDSNFKPKKTIMFMGYAAEEVGLLGSKEIARSFKDSQKNVIGVMQLDMTLHKGTPDKDIVMMSDFTNSAQNEFLGRLIDEYVEVPWGYSRCGYGCSDHASWTSNGYPASIPFESTMGDINRKIHTANDTLEQSGGGHAEHSVNFAKLATAFVVELSL